MTFEIEVKVKINDKQYLGCIPEQSVTLSVWELTDKGAKWVGSRFYDAANSAAGIAFAIADIVKQAA
jgi:hypothetical protein